MNSTCPFCGAETRPGDNFCLSCGNRLLSATPSPQQQQAQPGMGESTIPSQDGWGQPQAQVQSPYQVPTASPTVPASPASPAPSAMSWLDPAMPTLAGNSAEELPTTFSPGGSNAVQTASPAIEHAAKFILRADTGDVLQEYPLEKAEISIGRAPNSDILLSKDKLTSRRHATVNYSNGKYVLHDEHSANGTFVNGQQLDEASSHELQDGDHIGIGEHELIFRGSESTASSESMFADMPTVSVPFNPNPGQELTYRTREDELATSQSNDDFSTRSMENNGTADNNGQFAAVPPAPATPSPVEPPPVTPKPEEVPTPVTMQNNLPTSATAAPPPPNAQPVSPPTPPVAKPSAPQPSMMQSATYTPPVQSDANVTFNRLTTIPQPSVPDISPLLAALSTLDGQVMSLQEQMNATQEAVRSHEAEVAQTTNQLRAGVRRVSERMDDTIADVARNREALAWAELLQLMEDVMNNPRDIEYVTKLARKARELNKVFQLHQSVLNTLAECNSLLRSLIGDDRQK
ncbi:MAG TPA: FHA domain-containing protein [Ktedonobacteraceae bacterium]|nr:FHA domain-containing protein [Ktedonobacteraceae bacterium]